METVSRRCQKKRSVNMRAILLIVVMAVHWASAERFALLVGNDNAKGGYAPLKYVENDLACLRSILNDFCGFEKSRIAALYNGVPEDLDRLLSEIAAQTAQAKNTMFLFYFSGHADQENLKMGSEGYPIATLKEKLTSFPSEIRIGIFDACQSGSFTRIKGGTLSEPFLFKDDGKSKGQVFLSSSSVSENAQEFDAFRNSIFTFHLINALRGSGDVSGDSRVTLSEAYQYAFNHTISSTAGSAGGIQHPSYQFRIQGEGDIVLADLNIRSQGILLGQGLWGNVTIFNDKSCVVADLTKEKNSAVMIALGPGAYRIVKQRNSDRFETKVKLNGSGVVHVNVKDFYPISLPEAKKKGLLSGKRIIQWGISIAGVYERFDLSSLSSGLGDRFKDYGNFSISPSLSFPSRTRHVAVTFESIIRERFIGRLGGGSFSFASNADYSGSRVNEFDGKSYHYGLHLEKKLSVNIGDMSAGYRFTSRYLNHCFLLAGVNFYQADVKITSIFDDSLFNIQTSGTETASGTVFIPSLCVGYSWPITNFCDIGTELRYRYQIRPRELMYSSHDEMTAVHDILLKGNPPPLKCDFSGFDFRIFVNFNYKFRKVE